MGRQVIWTLTDADRSFRRRVGPAITRRAALDKPGGESPCTPVTAEVVGVGQPNSASY